MNSTETLVGKTTRPVTFSIVGNDKVVRHVKTFPAGTTVYVRETRRGLVARIPGTLYAQQVNGSAVEAI